MVPPHAKLADRRLADGRGAALAIGSVSVADLAQGLRCPNCRGGRGRGLRGHAALARRGPCLPPQIPIQHSLPFGANCRRGPPLQLDGSGDAGGEGTEGCDWRRF